MKGKIDSTMLQILTLNSTLINSQCVLCPLSCYIEVFNKPDKFITVGGERGFSARYSSAFYLSRGPFKAVDAIFQNDINL